MPGKRLGGKMQGVSTELSLAERAMPPNPSEQLLQVGQRSTKSKANALLLLLSRKPFSPLPALTVQSSQDVSVPQHGPGHLQPGTDTAGCGLGGRAACTAARSPGAALGALIPSC